MARRRKLDARNATLSELAYARTGSMLKAARVVSFVIAWDVVRRDLGRSPTVDEYAAWWKEPRSTAYGHRELFLQVFPHAGSPDAVLDLLEAQRARPQDRADFGGLVAA